MGLVLPEQDAWDHLRRAYLTFLNFPHPPYIDYFYGFPHGIHYNQPPFWELTLAFPARLIFGSRISAANFAAFAVYIPPLIGSLTVIAVFFLAKELFGKKTGYAAALISIFFPGLIDFSRIGNLDRHAFEVLLLTTLLAFLVRAIKLGGRSSYFAGFFLGLIVLASPTSPLVIGLIGMLLFIIAGFSKKLHLGKPIEAIAMRFYFTAGVVVILSLPFHAILLSFSFDRLSLLHLMLLLLFASIFFIYMLLQKRLGDKATTIVVVSAAFLSMAAFVFSSSFRTLTVVSIKRALGLFPLSGSISEWQPLFSSNGLFTLNKMVEHYSYAFFALPLIAALLFVNSARSRRPEIIFFTAWFALTAFLAVSATYYYPFFCIPFVSGLSFALSKPSDALATKSTRKALGTIVLTALLLVATIIFVPIDFNLSPTLSQMEKYEILKVAGATPGAGNPQNPSAIPGFTIMSPWSYGQYIISIANRPAVATGNFEANFQGFVDSQEFFQTDSESKALAIAKRDRVKYVFIGPAFSFGIGNLRLARANTSPEPQPFFVGAEGRWRYPQISRSLIWRLYTANGRAMPGMGLPALKHFKLIFCDTFGETRYQLYEIVP